MKTNLAVGIAFIGLAVIFLAIALQDHCKEQDKLTVTRNIRLRIAFIFAAVGIGLSFLHIFTHGF